MANVSVIGCGNMGGALVRGLVRAGYEDVTVYDIDEDVLEPVADLGVNTTTDPVEASEADLLFVAVKPAYVGEVVESLDLDADQTLVSVAAGVSRRVVSQHTDATVVRIMPNLAAEWGEMAVAIAGEEINDELRHILDEVGQSVVLEEAQMDTATAVNGSGPAFVFYLIQAMAEAGSERGLEPEQARTLAAQTFKGAAEIVLQSEQDIQELIDAVCSPKGTTIEGMAVLEESDADEALTEAVVAAEERATELATEVAYE